MIGVFADMPGARPGRVDLVLCRHAGHTDFMLEHMLRQRAAYDIPQADKTDPIFLTHKDTPVRILLLSIMIPQVYHEPPDILMVIGWGVPEFALPIMEHLTVLSVLASPDRIM